MLDIEAYFIELMTGSRIEIDSRYTKFFYKNRVVFLFYKNEISTAWINIDMIRQKIEITADTKRLFKDLLFKHLNIKLNALGYMRFDDKREVFERLN